MEINQYNSSSIYSKKDSRSAGVRSKSAVLCDLVFLNIYQSMRKQIAIFKKQTECGLVQHTTYEDQLNITQLTNPVNSASAYAFNELFSHSPNVDSDGKNFQHQLFHFRLISEYA